MICKKCGHGYEGNFCNNCGKPAHWKNTFKYNIQAWISLGVSIVFMAIILFTSLGSYIIKPKVEVDLPDLPDYYSCDSYSGKAEYQLKKADYVIKGNNITFTFTDKKTAERDPDSLTSAVTIQWKLYDERDRVVTGNHVTTAPLKTGETFTISDTDYKFDVERGEEYTLVIENYKS